MTFFSDEINNKFFSTRSGVFRRVARNYGRVGRGQDNSVERADVSFDARGIRVRCDGSQRPESNSRCPYLEDGLRAAGRPVLCHADRGGTPDVSSGGANGPAHTSRTKDQESERGHQRGISTIALPNRLRTSER